MEHIEFPELPEESCDSLTIRFERDGPGPNYKGKEKPDWLCYIGENFIEGCAGFGKTPWLALRDLTERIAQEEGYRTDGGKLLLR